MAHEHTDKVLAGKIGKAPEEVHPVVMKLLRDMTQENVKKNPNTNFEALGVTPKEIEDWFTAFARGAQYVADTYGTIFGQVAFVDTLEFNNLDGKAQTSDNIIVYFHGNEPDGTPQYDVAVVTKKFVAEQINRTRDYGAIFTNVNTGDQTFTGLQLATLLGVEESFHAYQLKIMADRYSEKDRHALAGDIAAVQNNTTHYEENAVERDARIAIAKAIKDLGFDSKAQSR